MINYTNSELCLIWLDSFLGLEYKHKKEIYKLINGKEKIKELLTKSKDYILSQVGERVYLSLLNSSNPSYLNYVLDGLERRKITAITIESYNYPKLLKETPFAPLVLYAKGRIELLNGDSFSIVGSRRSLPISIKLTEDFAKAIGKGKFTLVTGIAQGVDGKVLTTALDNGINAISVLAGGFDNVYPSENLQLVEKLCEKGLVISEYPPETPTLPHHFPIRNRIIAGLGIGVLIVSGAIKSGTQYTANYAIEYGRDLFAIPYSVGVASGTGCNDLIKKGAVLVDSPQDILSFYNIEEKKEKIEYSQEELLVINSLKDGELHVQKIASLLKKQVFEILPILSVLEIKGVINKNGVNVYGLCRSMLEE